MATDHYNILKEIQYSIRDYEMATGIKCYLLNSAGKKIGERSCYQCHNICRFIEKFDEGGECIHDYLHSCQPSLDTDEACFYRCPYGLLNIAIPILPNIDTVYFASSGPILTEPPNKSVIRFFMDKNQLTNKYYEEVGSLFHKVPIMGEDQLNALSRTLQKAVLPIVANNLYRFRNNNNLKNAITQELRKLASQASRTESREDFYLLQKELEILVEDKASDENTARKGALNMILDMNIRFVLEYDVFEDSKCKAANYLLAFWQAANNTNLDLGMVFDKDYIIMREFLVSHSRLSLSNIICTVSERFKRAAIYGNRNKNNEIILKAMTYIRRHYSDISLSNVARHVSLNPSYFSNLFKKETGQSYMEYLSGVRIEASKQLLWEDISLTEIAYNVGFTDQSHFINVFKRYENISPSKWKQQQYLILTDKDK